METIRKALGGILNQNWLKQILATPLYSNALYLMLDATVKTGLGFIFWVFVTQFYSEVAVGFSSAVISAMGLLATVSVLGLDVSLIRFLPQAEKPRELINTCFTIGTLSSLIISVAFLSGLNLWSPVLNFIARNPIFFIAFIIFTVAWTLGRLMNSVFIARRRTEFTLLKNAIFSLLKIPLPIFFVLYWHSFGVVASWGVASIVAFTLSLFLFLPKAQSNYRPVPTLDSALLKRIWRYSGGNYLAGLFSTVPSFLLPVMVVNLLGAESNAYYYVATMMASLLSAIPLAFSSSLFAEGSHFEDKLKDNVARDLKFTALLLIPSVLLFVFGGKWLLLLFGESYSVNALRLLQVLAISSLPLALSHIYSAILRVTHRTKELTMLWALATVTVLIVSYLLVPSVGIVGVGYAQLGVWSVLAVYILARKATIW